MRASRFLQILLILSRAALALAVRDGRIVRPCANTETVRLVPNGTIARRSVMERT